LEMNVYFVRHGQSEANAARTYSGWSHVPLTEKGLADAAKAGKILQNVHFDKVYSSDLKRARQTCEAALPGVEYETDALLREISTGILTGIKHFDALEKYGEAHKVCASERDYSRYGGESHQMHCERVDKFMKMLEENPVDGNVAVFCHDGTCKAILRYVLGVDFHPYRVTNDNGSVNVVSFNGTAWHLKHWNIVE